jgi:flagellar basal-body rod modification protein FlgD
MIDPNLPLQDVNDLTRFDGVQRDVPNQELGKDEFLQMLIAQLRHQDPLEPMSDQQFIADMAQFSSLEQMTNINETLKENLNWNYLLSQTINNTMATSLIGHEVKAAGNEVYLSEDEDALLNYKLGGFAEKVNIEIFDGAGKKVASYSIDNVGQGDQKFSWDGRTGSGDLAQPGTYTFAVSGTNSDGDAIAATPYMRGLVDGVEYNDGQAYLVVNGTRVSLGDVIQVGISEDEDG